MTMTANPSNRSDFRKHLDEYKELPEDVVLGHVAWFSVADHTYDGDQIAADFARLGLNEKFLPRGLKPDAAFEKASKVPHGFKYEVSGGHTAELMVRELDRDSEKIVRQITREVRDGKAKRLLYGPVGELVFYKPPTRNGVVDYSGAAVRYSIAEDVSASERVVISAQLEAFSDAYNRHCRFHDGQKIRALVRNYLLHLNSIMLKPSGGVYFVFQNRAAELQALQQFMNGLTPEATSMTLLPLADLPHLRVEVTEAFEREAAKDFQEVVAEIAKLAGSRVGPIKLEAFTKLRKQYDEVVDKAKEYTRRLDVSQATTAASAEAALAALNVLQEQVIAEQMRQANAASPGA